jgi:hypothetical protein
MCFEKEWQITLLEEEFGDTYGVIKIRKSKDTHNGQKKKYKRTNNNV